MFSVVKRNPVAVLLALLLHLALGFFLLFGMEWDDKPQRPRTSAPVVQAKAVEDPAKLAAAKQKQRQAELAAERKKQQAAQKRKQAVERKKRLAQEQ
ncbi:hypothetical protein QQ73_04975, partial [Candidatus Endoriftia persephone str. Guaymas]|nr:hypothetical protein [Candidatus Endoriftia persephone str. Guaymas]